MQISSNNSLPVIAGSRPEPALLQSVRPPRTQISPENQTNQNAIDSGDQGNRRPPLFIQSMRDGNLSRSGEQAMRTYRDVAMAGEPAELVNRLDVMA
jgi:hypothetical protein